MVQADRQPARQTQSGERNLVGAGGHTTPLANRYIPGQTGLDHQLAWGASAGSCITTELDPDHLGGRRLDELENIAARTVKRVQVGVLAQFQFQCPGGRIVGEGAIVLGDQQHHIVAVRPEIVQQGPTQPGGNLDSIALPDLRALRVGEVGAALDRSAAGEIHQV